MGPQNYEVEMEISAKTFVSKINGSFSAKMHHWRNAVVTPATARHLVSISNAAKKPKFEIFLALRWDLEKIWHMPAFNERSSELRVHEWAIFLSMFALAYPSSNLATNPKETHYARENVVSEALLSARGPSHSHVPRTEYAIVAPLHHVRCCSHGHDLCQLICFYHVSQFRFKFNRL